MRGQKCSQDLQPHSCLSVQFISSSAENLSAAFPLITEKRFLYYDLPIFSAAAYQFFLHLRSPFWGRAQAPKISP